MKVFLWKLFENLVEGYTGTAIAIAGTRAEAEEQIVTDVNIPTWIDMSQADAASFLKEHDPEIFEVPCGFTFLGGFMRELNGE